MKKRKLNETKLKKMANAVKDSVFALQRRLKQIYNTEIFTDEDMNDLINENPTVKTFERLNRHVIMTYKGYDHKSRYYLYDIANFDDSESYMIRKRVLDELFDALGLPGTVVYRKADNSPKRCCSSVYYFTVNRGRNGSGDFVNVDMKEISDIINIMRTHGASTATPLDVFIDVTDDVSDWLIGFKIDEEEQRLDVRHGCGTETKK